jgi:hypothetical protein
MSSADKRKGAFLHLEDWSDSSKFLFEICACYEMVQGLLGVFEMANRVAPMREIRNAYRILDRQLNEAWETWA